MPACAIFLSLTHHNPLLSPHKLALFTNFFSPLFPLFLSLPFVVVRSQENFNYFLYIFSIGLCCYMFARWKRGMYLFIFQNSLINCILDNSTKLADLRNRPLILVKGFIRMKGYPNIYRLDRSPNKNWIISTFPCMCGTSYFHTHRQRDPHRLEHAIMLSRNGSLPLLKDLI